MWWRLARMCGTRYYSTPLFSRGPTYGLNQMAIVGLGGRTASWCKYEKMKICNLYFFIFPGTRKYENMHVFMFSCFRNMKIWKDICFHVFMFSCCHVLILTCLMCTLLCFIGGAPGRSGHLGRLRCLRVLLLPLGFFRLSRVVASFSYAFFRFAVLVFVLNRFAEVWSVHSDSSTTMLRAHSPL